MFKNHRGVLYYSLLLYIVSVAVAVDDEDKDDDDDDYDDDNNNDDDDGGDDGDDDQKSTNTVSKIEIDDHVMDQGIYLIIFYLFLFVSKYLFHTLNRLYANILNF